MSAGIPSCLILSGIFKNIDKLEKINTDGQKEVVNIQNSMRDSLNKTYSSVLNDVEYYDAVENTILNIDNEEEVISENESDDNEGEILIESSNNGLVKEIKNVAGKIEKVLSEEEKNEKILLEEIQNAKESIVSLAFESVEDFSDYSLRWIGVEVMGGMIMYNGKPMVKRYQGKLKYFKVNDSMRIVEFCSSNFRNVYVLVHKSNQK